MKVLVAEDSPVSSRLLQRILAKWGYDVVAVSDGTAAWEALQSPEAPRLAILDWVMPGLDGLEVCQRVRQHRAEPYTYMLLLTSRSDKADTVLGMAAGADDYLTKPFNAEELRMRLRAGRRILDLQAELVAAREILRHQATHDPLTGLWNRAMAMDFLSEELARAGREGTPLSVIMVDLDDFKNVNDAHGHLGGDAVLREVAQRMQAAIRPYDRIGRYGGEEFLVVLPGCAGTEVAAVSERLRAKVAADAMDTSEGLIPVTLSLGATSTESPSLSTVKELVHAADTALYRAKAEGRDRVVLAGPHEWRPGSDACDGRTCSSAPQELCAPASASVE